MCIAPASGGAIVARPGMNLPRTRVIPPQRSKWFSVWRTHESGDSEMRQRVVMTRRPYCRPATRSEEHTSELQSQSNLVCRLLLEKKKINVDIADRSYTPPQAYAALASVRVNQATLDLRVFELLRTLFAFGFFDHPECVYDTRQDR